MLERFDLERPIAIGDFDAEAFARGERDHLVGGKLPLGENVEHFAAHIAGRADHGDGVTHQQLLHRNLARTAVAAAGAQRLLREKSRKHNVGGLCRAGAIWGTARGFSAGTVPSQRLAPNR